MKRVSFFIILGVLILFGLLTTFLSTSIIFDLFNVRAHEGNYVLLVVQANFISGLLYLLAAFAFYKKKAWAAVPLIISLLALVIAAAGFIVHVHSGGAYETKTIGALTFRIAVNIVLAILVNKHTKKVTGKTAFDNLVVAALPFLLLLSACGAPSDTKHETVQEEGHHHGAEVGAIELNNGEKWEADENTRSVVATMESQVSGFEAGAQTTPKALSDSLTRQMNLLVSGCTMKGKGHDELHKWIMPLTDQIKHLSAAKTPDETSQIVGELKESFETFHRSFK
ncbi:MAG TPA: hypothetical protein VF490_18980 [Chryseosolibacter sp.]